MVWIYILLGVVALIALAALVCFVMTYYSPTRTEEKMLAERYPPGHVYVPYHPAMKQWAEAMDAMEYHPR